MIRKPKVQKPVSSTKRQFKPRAKPRLKKAASFKATIPLYRKTVLSNGVRVVTEAHPRARGVAVGFWVTCGTRDETPDVAGVSHFVEHLVFKRTEKRTAFQIARDMEAVGGELNAFTGREYTCFYTHSLREHMALSIDVLADLVGKATFDASDFEKEKQVVLQEIHMSEDMLEDLIFDVYLEKAYGKAPLGWPILGTAKSIAAMKREDVIEYYRSMYVGENIIVSVAGDVDHDEVVELVERKLKLGRERQKAGTSGQKKWGHRSAPELQAFRDVMVRPSEQVHILMGLPASSFTDPLRFEAYIINTLLGGGMTSKLYQSVREERGLVYSIYSQLTTFIDSGMCLIYAGTEKKYAREVCELTMKEFNRLKTHGVTAADMKLFKTQVTGQILLGADDIENRMNSLGVNEMVFNRYRSVEEVMADVAKVSQRSLKEYILAFLDTDKLGIQLMGAAKPETTNGWLRGLK
jgi:predicted Zn-dependent peptidase